MTSVFIQPADLLNRAIDVTQRAPDFLVVPFNTAIVQSPDIVFSASDSVLVITKRGTYQCLGRVQLIYVMKPTSPDIPVFTQFRVTMELSRGNTGTWVPLTSSFQDLLPNYQNVSDGRWNTVPIDYMATFHKGDALRLIVDTVIAKAVPDVGLYSCKIGTTEPGVNSVDTPPFVPVTLFSVNRIKCLKHTLRPRLGFGGQW